MFDIQCQCWKVVCPQCSRVEKYGCGGPVVDECIVCRTLKQVSGVYVLFRDVTIHGLSKVATIFCLILEPKFDSTSNPLLPSSGLDDDKVNTTLLFICAINIRLQPEVS